MNQWIGSFSQNVQGSTLSSCMHSSSQSSRRFFEDFLYDSIVGGITWSGTGRQRGDRADPARPRVALHCKKQVVSKCKQELLQRVHQQERQSVTPCPGTGSFAGRPPSFLALLPHPVCGGRSFGGVPVPIPEPLHPDPGRSAGPGFLARRMGSKRCVFTLLCNFVLAMAGSQLLFFGNTEAHLSEVLFHSCLMYR